MPGFWRQGGKPAKLPSLKPRLRAQADAVSDPPRASEHSWRDRPLGWKGDRRRWDLLVSKYGVEEANRRAQMEVHRGRR
jgi:hypothetical protein